MVLHAFASLRCQGPDERGKAIRFVFGCVYPRNERNRREGEGEGERRCKEMREIERYRKQTPRTQHIRSCRTPGNGAHFSGQSTSEFWGPVRA